jgi:hypothetical protein
MSSQLKRTNSGRDKTKAIPQLSDDAPQPKAYYLVVCGAKNHEADSWFFGDFLGFCRVLKSHGIGGDFLNCFPIEEFFNQSGYKEVKFGRKGGPLTKSSWNPVEIYTEWEFEHRARFWAQVPQNLLRTQVLEWMEKKAKNLKPRDSATIVLVAHGNTQGICLGADMLGWEQLANACSHFMPHVQVNIVIKSCHSGAFADKLSMEGQLHRYVHTSAAVDQLSWADRRSPSGRFRNSAFGAAIVKTFSFMKEPPKKMKVEQWSIENQKEFVEKEIGPKNVYQNRPGNPQLYTDLDLQTTMADIIFHDYVDISLNTAQRGPSRVLTPMNPAATIAIPSNLPEPPSTEYCFAAASTISKEMDMIDNEQPYPSDIGLVQAAFGTRPRKKGVEQINILAREIGGLAWRIRMQENFFFAMEALANKDLIRLDSLSFPIDFSVTSASQDAVIQILSCFEHVKILNEPNNIYLGGGFNFPAHWLATLIIRSSANPSDAFSFLETSRLLGALDYEKFDDILSKKVWANPTEGYDNSKGWEQGYYGAWLPHGLGDQNARQHFKGLWTRYLGIKEAYEGFFQGQWGDASEIEEHISLTFAEGDFWTDLA